MFVLNVYTHGITTLVYRLLLKFLLLAVQMYLYRLLFIATDGTSNLVFLTYIVPTATAGD